MVSLPEARARVKLPTGVDARLTGRTVSVKGPKGELSRTFPPSRVEILKDEKGLLVRCSLPRRSEKASVGTFASHLKNLVDGVTKGFEYRLKTVFAHFPIKSSVKGDTFVIENFLGERSPRKARILSGVKVEAKGEFVTVSGVDLEKVSQTAANIERATKVRGKDIRVFQDGIYIIQKAA
jgi:large subunit ribosomal protein L6